MALLLLFSDPIMGLRNCGNSCFLNAILQALASCRFMLGWLRQKDEECNLGLPRPVTVLESYNGISYPLIAAMFRAIKSNWLLFTGVVPNLLTMSCSLNICV